MLHLSRCSPIPELSVYYLSKLPHQPASLALVFDIDSYGLKDYGSNDGSPTDGRHGRSYGLFLRLHLTAGHRAVLRGGGLAMGARLVSPDDARA